MSDLILVLQMANELGLAGQAPLKAAPVRGRVLLGRADADVGKVDCGGSLVHEMDKSLDVHVHQIVLRVVLFVKTVVQKNVS